MILQLLTEFCGSFIFLISSVGSDTEKILLSAFTKLTNSPADSVDQSDGLSEMVDTIQLNVELVKVEVVVMTEEEQEEVEETVLSADQDVCNQNSEGGEECSVTPVIMEVFRSGSVFGFMSSILLGPHTYSIQHVFMCFY